MATEFKSPARKIIPFLENSRDNWKEKHQLLKVEHRNLERRHQYALDKLSEFKERISELESQLTNNEATKLKKRKSRD